MSALNRERLFGFVMFWTIATTVFAWLPLARIIGRPDGYTWQILRVSGAGTEGPFWIFILLTAYAVTLLLAAFRGPRALFYPMLLLWHFAVTAVVLAGAIRGGPDAVLQGQGLHFSIPLWLLGAPFVLFTMAALVWVALDHRSGAMRATTGWARANTGKLAASLLLAIVALVLFRLGNNYNWVTALAIVVAVLQWIVMAQSFAPVKRGTS